MPGLEEINFQFPINTPEEAVFFNSLWHLFKKLPGAVDGLNMVSLSSKFPPDSRPKLVLEGSTENMFPVLKLDPTAGINYNFGELAIISDEIIQRTTVWTKNDQDTWPDKDALGNYYKTWVGGNQYFLLNIDEFANRFGPNILGLDHAGVNLPKELLSTTEFENITLRLSQIAQVFAYPGQPNWQFILPSGPEERLTGQIQNFTGPRQPKMEFVHDTYLKVPTIQFDFQSKLPKETVLKLLPAPYGLSYPEVKDFFRSVYIHHPWKELLIRFDVRFGPVSKPDNWSSGRILVENKLL